MESMHRREAWNKGDLLGQKPSLRYIGDLCGAAWRLASQEADGSLAIAGSVPVAFGRGCHQIDVVRRGAIGATAGPARETAG